MLSLPRKKRRAPHSGSVSVDALSWQHSPFPEQTFASLVLLTILLHIGCASSSLTFRISQKGKEIVDLRGVVDARLSKTLSFVIPSGSAKIVIHYEEGTAAEARAMLQQMERMYAVLHTELGPGFLPNTRLFLLQLSPIPDNYTFLHRHSATWWSSLYLYSGKSTFLDPMTPQTWLFFWQLAHEVHHVATFGRLKAWLPDWYGEGVGDLLGLITVTRLYGTDAMTLSWLQRRENQSAEALLQSNIRSRLLTWHYERSRKTRKHTPHSLATSVELDDLSERLLFHRAAFSLARTIYGWASENSAPHPLQTVLDALDGRNDHRHIPQAALLKIIHDQLGVDVDMLLARYEK